MCRHVANHLCCLLSYGNILEDHNPTSEVIVLDNGRGTEINGKGRAILPFHPAFIVMNWQPCLTRLHKGAGCFFCMGPPSLHNVQNVLAVSPYNIFSIRVAKHATGCPIDKIQLSFLVKPADAIVR